MLFPKIGSKRFVFAGGKIRERVVGPDLTVRMGIAGAHQFATIFEDLDVTNPRNLREHGELLDPGIDDAAQFKRAHSRDGEIVARRKAQDAAGTAIRLRDEQSILFTLHQFRVRQQRWKIVVENIRFAILRSLLSIGPLISWA